MEDDDNSGSGATKAVGLIIAVVSNALIGVSFIIKKRGLNVKSGGGAYSYLREPIWWAGMITMVVGEVGNFAAYTRAPAILVTPLGAIAVFVNAFLAHFILGETLATTDKLGMMLCVIGTTIIIIVAPGEGDVDSLDYIEGQMRRPMFVGYAVCMIFCIVGLMWAARVWGQRHILVYIMLCSLVGALAVLACKGLGVVVTMLFRGINPFDNPLSWFFLISVAVMIVSQVNYLNKALDTFGTSRVVPVYYVTFTTSTLTGSMVLFEEHRTLYGFKVFYLLIGCGVTFWGVYLLHASKRVEPDAQRYEARELIGLNEDDSNGNDTLSESLTALNSPLANRA